MNPLHFEKIFNTIWEMKKLHYAETTIAVTNRRLKLIAKTANLDNPEKVTEYLANIQVKNSYKESLANAYYRYVRFNNIKWQKPIIKRSSQFPYVPTTEELTAIISDAGKKYSMILSILKDTGMRPVEIERTCKKWFDQTRGAINVETAKHGNGRTLKLSSNTITMVNEYFGRNRFGMNDKVFPKVKTFRSAYTRLRRRTAEKLQRPELLRISLYSFRHYFATMLYHKTKDILYVKQQMGHKNLENTLIYTHLVNFQDEEYHARTATTKEEALKLIEAGFEYVTEIEGTKIFRKRK